MSAAFQAGWIPPRSAPNAGAQLSTSPRALIRAAPRPLPCPAGCPAGSVLTAETVLLAAVPAEVPRCRPSPKARYPQPWRALPAASPPGDAEHGDEGRWGTGQSQTASLRDPAAFLQLLVSGGG